MTDGLNPSQVWIYLEGNGKPLRGSKQGCGLVRQVF